MFFRSKEFGFHINTWVGCVSAAQILEGGNVVRSHIFGRCIFGSFLNLEGLGDFRVHMKHETS